MKKNLRSYGDITEKRSLTPNDWDKFYKLKVELPDYVDDDVKPILVVEGWLSTEEKDRLGDILLASAWKEDLPDFMKNSSLLYNHNWDKIPLGIWSEMTIVDNVGLYGVAFIYDTTLGRDVAKLIRAGAIRSFSVGFNATEWETLDDGGYKFIRAQALEGSAVTVPANLGAIITTIREKNLKLEHIKLDDKIGRTKKMEPEVIKKQIDDKVDPIIATIDSNKTGISELDGKVKDLAKIHNELIEFKTGSVRTQSETKELIEKINGDFTKTVEELNEIKNKMKVKTVSPFFGDKGSMSIKSMAKRTPAELDVSLPADKANLVKEYQRLNDSLMYMDAALTQESMNSSGDYHQENRAVRIKRLKTYKEFNDFAKAMDTATASEGTEYVPTELSGQIIELVRLNEVVAPLFQTIPMPTKNYEVPIETADTYATLHGEVTTVTSAFDSVEQTPGTGKITFTSKKARSRVQISAEEVEDSIIPMLEYIQKHTARGIARSKDRAIINGDSSATHFDTGTGLTSASTDFRVAFKGLRYHANQTLGSSIGVDISTFAEDNLRDVRGNMLIHGLYPDELAWICSSKTYLKKFLKDLDSVQTMDKFGPLATVSKGELIKFDGIATIVSAFVGDNLNADGIYDGATTDRSTVLLVNKLMWLQGVRKNVELAMEKDIINDVYQLVAFWRGDFQPTVTPSASNVIVNEGYNITFS